MVNLIKQFLIVFIVVYCLSKIFLYFKNRSKKLKNIISSDLILLVKLYGIDINSIGIKKVENDTTIINSIIITIDLLIYYNISNLIFSMIAIFVITFVLIAIGYYILANIYLRNSVR